MVDTGFNGTLFLPRDFIGVNDFALIGEESFHSVGQAEAQLSQVFSAKIEWLGEDHEISIIASEHGSALVGAEMMIEARLEMITQPQRSSSKEFQDKNYEKPPFPFISLCGFYRVSIWPSSETD